MFNERAKKRSLMSSFLHCGLVLHVVPPCVFTLPHLGVSPPNPVFLIFYSNLQGNSLLISVLIRKVDSKLWMLLREGVPNKAVWKHHTNCHVNQISDILGMKVSNEEEVSNPLNDLYPSK